MRDLVAREEKEWADDSPELDGSGNVELVDKGPWGWVKARIRCYGARWSFTTDRASGDPLDVDEWKDWIGPSRTIPESLAVEELNKWAIFRCTHHRTNNDVGYWGSQSGSYVTDLRADGTITVAEPTEVEYRDVSPESKIVKYTKVLTAESPEREELPTGQLPEILLMKGGTAVQGREFTLSVQGFAPHSRIWIVLREIGESLYGEFITDDLGRATIKIDGEYVSWLPGKYKLEVRDKRNSKAEATIEVMARSTAPGEHALSFLLQWGSYGRDYGGTDPENVKFDSPRGVAVDPSGNVYVVDTNNGRVQKFTPDGKFIMSWGKPTTQGEHGRGILFAPVGIAIDRLGNVYVLEKVGRRVTKLSSDHKFIQKWGREGPKDGQFNDPTGIAVDHSSTSGAVYVTDTGNGRIQKFTLDGKFIKKWDTYGGGAPAAVAVDPSGNVYVANRSKCCIEKFNSEGSFTVKWGGEGSGNGQFHTLRGIAVDPSGNIYVADARLNDSVYQHIQKFTSGGKFLTKWETTSQRMADHYVRTAPEWEIGIAADKSGTVYITNPYNNRVRKFSSVVQ